MGQGSGQLISDASGSSTVHNDRDSCMEKQHSKKAVLEKLIFFIVDIQEYI